MQYFSTATIQHWERFYRANFINTITGYKSASLIGTVNAQGQPNLAIFSNIVHLGADPALVGFVNRPLAAAPHTISNIQATKAYTINHIHPSFLAQAHQTSAKYAADVNEFAAVGLTEEYMPNITAPFVQESKVKYALELVEVIPITYNNTFFVIGKVTDAFVADNLLQPDGFINLQAAETVTSLGLDAYYATNFIDRLPYAKP